MDPISFQKIDQKNDAAECPCDGVGPGNRGQLVDKLYRYGDICYPDQAPAGQHGEHGDSGFSRAPKDRAITTPAPMDTPLKKLIIMKIRLPEELTAARASSPM